MPPPLPKMEEPSRPKITPKVKRAASYLKTAGKVGGVAGTGAIASKTAEKVLGDAKPMTNAQVGAVDKRPSERAELIATFQDFDDGNVTAETRIVQHLQDKETFTLLAKKADIEAKLEAHTLSQAGRLGVIKR